MSTKPTKLYGDLQPGDRFYSPRKDEGVVTVVCSPGTCTHDVRDMFSCHVRSATFGTEFFVLHYPDEPVELYQDPWGWTTQ
jgi:hypothetical protein